MEETLRECDLTGYLRALEEVNRLAELIESTYSLRAFDPAEQTPSTSSGRSDPTGAHAVKRESLEEDLAIARERAGEAFRETLGIIDAITSRPEIPVNTLKLLLDLYLDGKDIKEAAIRAGMSLPTAKSRLLKVWKIPRAEIFKD